MHHTLHPPLRATRPASTDIRPVVQTSLKHLRHYANVHLRISSAIPGPSHNATMFWCEVLKWSEPKSLDGSEVPSAEKRKVMLVLQSVGGEYPRVGLDARVVQQRMEKRGSSGSGIAWEIGVWTPWSKVELPSAAVRADDVGETLELMGDAAETEVDGPHDTRQMTTAIFASRYLIAESASHCG